MTDLRDENFEASELDNAQKDLNRISEPECFESTDTPAHSQQKARLPDVEQAVVTHYAYDPQTYEILCRPGQRLSHRKAQRLQDLDLYAHVVSFAE